MDPVRQLEEALDHGPDPLHLQRLFGLSDAAAMRCAQLARCAFETALAMSQPSRRDPAE